LLFSATVPSWVRDIAREHMRPDFRVVDLAQDLKNKTARNVRHLAIDCPFHERLDALAKVCKYLYNCLMLFSKLLWRHWKNYCLYFNQS
jgi:superfamily II DNA/RNA helicase